MKAHGYDIRVIQDTRSPEYQQKLYEDYKSGRSKNVAAPPQPRL
jgi:5'-3' exonuclease